MTYRTNPTTGDRVSLLGFGMMRLPSVRRNDTEEIDQQQVNELVDYAIAHGVNYFDTSPAYCRGFSERATGTALARYPRQSYYIATKLSNFSPATWSREASMEMYRNSFRELRTDYIDYLLLHGIGMGSDGVKEFEARYIDNGMLDFLLANARPGVSATSGSPTTATSACSTACSPNTIATSGISCRSSSTTSTGATPSRSTSGTPMPSTSTASWRNAASRPSSWNRCWAGASRTCPTTSWRASSSANPNGASPRGPSVLRGRSPGC